MLEIVVVEGEGREKELQLHLQSCICGQHGIAVIYYPTGPKVTFQVWTLLEAQLLHDRLMEDGGVEQTEYLDEMARAQYLVEDIYPDQPTNLYSFLISLGIIVDCRGDRIS